MAYNFYIHDEVSIQGINDMNIVNWLVYSSSAETGWIEWHQKAGLLENSVMMISPLIYITHRNTQKQIFI